MQVLSCVIDRIRLWYRGKYIPPRKTVPWEPFVFVGPGHYEQPLFARILGAIGRFLVARWQSLIGILIALLSILVNILLHRRHP